MSGLHRASRVRHPWVALLVVALASGTCSSPSPPRKPHTAPLTLAGTEYLAPLFRAEILAFRDRYPDSDSIRIQANGSAEGMEQLVNGEVSMSLLLRELTDPEVDAAIKRNGLQGFTVAWDAVAVIVNPASPIEQISKSELGEIYGGSVTEWSSLGWNQGGQVIALTAGTRLGIFAYLQQALLGSGSYASTVYAPPTEDQVVEVVATRPNAIACVSRAYAERAGARVRVLRVSQAKGLPYVELSRESILTKQYPLLRSITIATPANPSSSTGTFIDFVSGMDGQQIVARFGYAPATVPIRIVRTVEEVP